MQPDTQNHQGIDKAFILAAGFGTRLRPHTLSIPKPLVTVGTDTLLDHTLDHLSDAGITETVINTHYLADTLHKHIQTRKNPKITLSHEPEILDTGGGIYNALQHFNNAPFFVLSGDGYWSNPPQPNPTTLRAMQTAWNPDIMDILILLQPVNSMQITHGVGDYTLSTDGKATRSLDQSGTHMFTSMRINHPRIFQNTPSGPFSYLALLDEAQERGRLYGLEHAGDWHHISTPQDLAAVRKHTGNG